MTNKSTEEKLLEIGDRSLGSELPYIADNIAEQIDHSEYRLVKLGKHDIIITLGDYEIYALCACGEKFATSDESFDAFTPKWKHHVMTETSGYPDLGDE